MLEPYCSICHKPMDFEEAPIVAGTNGPMIIVEPCCCPEEEEEVLDFLKTVDTDSEEDLEDGLNYLSRVKRDLNKFMDLVGETDNKELHDRADELLVFEMEFDEIERILRKTNKVMAELEGLREELITEHKF